MLFANFDCTIRIYLNCNVNNMCFIAIVYSYYKNMYIYIYNIKNPPTLRILRCRDHAPCSEYSWIRHCVRFYFIYILYKFFIAVNPSFLGVFLHICIICKYFYIKKTQNKTNKQKKQQGRIVYICIICKYFYK